MYTKPVKLVHTLPSLFSFILLFSYLLLVFIPLIYLMQLGIIFIYSPFVRVALLIFLVCNFLFLFSYVQYAVIKFLLRTFI